MLGTHYRQDVNVSDEIIENARTELNKVLTALRQGQVKLALAERGSDEINNEEYRKFLDAMEDDLNTPNAYGEVFEMTKLINQGLRTKEIDYDSLSANVNALKKMLDVLGIRYPTVSVSDEDRKLYGMWLEAKNAKDFELADSYRDQLTQKGIL